MPVDEDEALLEPLLHNDLEEVPAGDCVIVPPYPLLVEGEVLQLVKVALEEVLLAAALARLVEYLLQI